ncbi:MAG: zinc dependent phospholipase C family protein [Bryobacteraceae bacterium]
MALWLVLAIVQPCLGYSVLAHEAVVDALWDVSFKPILLARFPNATAKDLKEAHAYAYGGAIIQDLGYYPHANARFSDITHYLRTGDFIAALIAESQNVDEFAFALGALSHYMSDIDGHRLATNPGEAMLYPKLKRKYGPVITYEDNPVAHLQTEFGFDVLEIAKGNFAPQAYHDFIGFNVATSVLERAFFDTYGLELKDLFDNFDRTVGSYRRAVSKTIPKATRVAWAIRKDEIERLAPGMTRGKFLYTMERSSYEREWGKQYDHPSAGERTLAMFLKLLPPIGPLKALRFKLPTQDVENLFAQSFDRSTTQCRATVGVDKINAMHLENKNYDVGVITPAGVYRLDDDTHAYWLNLLAQKSFATVTAPISDDLLSYYRDLNAPLHTKKRAKDWKRLLTQLEGLKCIQSPERTVGSKTSAVARSLTP